MNTLILASSSPQRLSLLYNIGYKPDRVTSPCIDKTIRAKELPRDYCKRISLAKALKVSSQFTKSFVLGVCTVMSRGRMILTKPHHIDDAYKLFKLLSGRRHSVFTGICVIKNNKTTIFKIVQTKIKFKVLSYGEIEYLIHSNEWQNQHGCYSFNTISGAFIEWVNGHPSNVIGLPVHETYKILNGVGLKQQSIIYNQPTNNDLK